MPNGGLFNGFSYEATVCFIMRRLFVFGAIMIFGFIASSAWAQKTVRLSIATVWGVGAIYRRNDNQRSIEGGAGRL
jgi:hypothetical protein